MTESEVIKQQNGKFEISYYTFIVKIEGFDVVYYDCLIHQIDSLFPIYINLHKDKRFPFIEYTRPNANTDKIEYQSYLNRKEMQMPMWVLNQKNFEQIVQKCEELSKGL